MRIFPIASDGWRFILPAVVLGLILIALGMVSSIVLGGVVLLFAAFSVFFFRDFDRAAPPDPAVIVSPGDGKVVDVSPSTDGDFAGGRLIRIFLSVFDGHVQRSPVEGRIESVRYKKGRFLDARDLRAHVENEQSAMTIGTERGRIVVTQIAGLIARRIVTWTREGQTLTKGERYGLIRFGSQVDVLLPKNTETSVKPGDRVVAGVTVIARWSV